jgi:hypothetical protein
MAYFTDFSNIQYPSPFSDRTSNRDYVTAKNIFRRAKIRDDFFQNVMVFDKYEISGDERPDQVAEALYGDAELDWVVLLSNNIINVRTEWPMSQEDLQRYATNKYGINELTATHHYVTKEVKNSYGQLIVPAGLEVDEDYSITYRDFSGNVTVSGTTVRSSVTNYEHEMEKNDEKRQIYALRSSYLEIVETDLREIMTYTDSSQFIDRRTKRAENLRLLSPR